MAEPFPVHPLIPQVEIIFSITEEWTQEKAQIELAVANSFNPPRQGESLNRPASTHTVDGWEVKCYVICKATIDSAMNVVEDILRDTRTWNDQLREGPFVLAHPGIHWQAGIERLSWSFSAYDLSDYGMPSLRYLSEAYTGSSRRCTDHPFPRSCALHEVHITAAWVSQEVRRYRRAEMGELLHWSDEDEGFA